ncbi:MAG: hypothetical protein CMI30_11640 [Opitutae bacterium]|nr:hypothetical protein [Opitutae bacterium]
MHREPSLTRRKFLVAVMATPWLDSCRSKSPRSSTEARHGIDTYFPIRIDGKTLQLQLAISEKEKNLGLMHRKKLPEDHGMVFLYDKPGRKSFWMKNTWIPLDIGFFSPDGALLEVRKLYPQDETSVKSGSTNVLFAIELNRNAYREKGISIGAKTNLDELRKAVLARGFDPTKYGIEKLTPRSP